MRALKASQKQLGCWTHKRLAKKENKGNQKDKAGRESSPSAVCICLGHGQNVFLMSQTCGTK